MRIRRVPTTTLLSALLIASLAPASLGAPKHTIGTYGSAGMAVLGPKVSYAGTTLECGNKSYHVTTGTQRGKCENIYAPDGVKKIGVSCKDGNGNYGGASCTEGCLGSSGAGDCTIK